MARPPRFLIIKLAALGDIAVASTLLARIRASHPDAHVTWLVGEMGAPMVRLFPGLDKVLTVDERMLLRGSPLERGQAILRSWMQLVGRRVDRVFLVHADRRYRVLSAPLLGVPVVSLEHGSNPLANRFRGDEYARLFDAPGSAGPIVEHYPLADVRPNLPPSPALTSVRRTVALVPGGARNILREDALRRWPVENYRELARRLLAAGMDVLLVGDAKDDFVRPHFLDLAVRDQIGSLSLVELLCALRDAALVVAHDTGPLHLARLVRTPAVALFGPTDPRQMVGSDEDVQPIWGGEKLACRPCYDGYNYAACTNNLCMQQVTVGQVLDAVTDRLADRTS